MLLRRLALPVALAATMLTCPARADDRATAQELFTQAKELMADGKTAEACEKFSAASELSQTVGVRLNLAACYEQIGRTASAWSRYDEALTLAERSGDAAAAQLARTSREALTPHLSYLSITISGGVAAIPQLTLVRDGQPVPEPAWGISVPVDPGEHTVKALAPGHKAWTQVVNVTGEGTRADVEVPLLVVDASAPAEQPAGGFVAPPPPRGFFSGPGGTQHVIAAGWIVVGAVALGVGAIFGTLMLSQRSDYEKNLGANGQCSNPDCQTQSSAAYLDGNVATAGFVAGGVLVAAGAVLWATAPRLSSKPASTATIVPVAGAHGAGLGIEGSW